MIDCGLRCHIIGQSIEVSWNENKSADGYYVWGMDSCCVYHLMGKRKNTECHYMWSAFEKRDVIKIKISAFLYSDGNELIIAESQPCMVPDYYEEYMDVKALHSFHGITLSWTDMDYAEGYYILKKIEEKWERIAELEDHLITFPTMEKGDQFVITAYRVKDGIKQCYKFSECFIYKDCEKKQNEKKEISIVIPCYNSEIYVSRCIDSVMASSCHNFEVILVNDGSVDKTNEILYWYKKQYPAVIEVIEQENAGVGAARNIGIEMAKGEAICFVDSDDMIHPKMLERMYQQMKKLDVDVVVAQYYKYEMNKKTRSFCMPWPIDQILPIERVLSGICINKPTPTMRVMVWNKMYRTSIVKKHVYAPTMVEDLAWTPYILSYMKTACYVDEPLYRWDRRVQYRVKSASDVIHELPEEDHLKKTKEALEFFICNGAPEKKKLLVAIAIRRLSQIYDCAKKHQLHISLIKYLDKQYGPLFENPYIKEDNNLCQFLNNIEI